MPEAVAFMFSEGVPTRDTLPEDDQQPILVMSVRETVLLIRAPDENISGTFHVRHPGMGIDLRLLSINIRP